MEPHSLPQQTRQLQTSSDEYLHTNIPWWHNLPMQARTELQLSPLTELRTRRVDVAVIGGGVAGLSAALSAGEAGAQTLLLDATTGLGRGATGRNAGIISAGVNMGIADLDPHGPEARFWPATTEVLLDLVTEAQREESLLQASLTGALSLAQSASAARRLAREVKARQALGVRAEIWTAAQVAAYTEGRLHTDEVVSAMWLPDEGCIQPLTLLAHLARAARASGVEMIGGAMVTTWTERTHGDGGSDWLLCLSDGTTIEAQSLVLAVGPTVQPTACIYALALESDLPATFPLFWDASPYTYVDFRSGQGWLTASGGRYGKVGGAHAQRYYQRLIDDARYWLPELAERTPTYQWSVDLDITAAMVPNLRELGREAPGLAIEGLGALGVLPGIILGRRGGSLLARVLAGEHVNDMQSQLG